MFLKKLYDNLDTLVDDSMYGSRLQMLGTDIYSMQLPNSRITVRRPEFRKPKGLVKMAGGGGAGHEGAPGIRCSPGGSDAGVTGDVFAAPSGAQIFRALKEIDDGSPIILGVANHAGDVLNAKLCMQMAKAAGMDVHMSLSYNDVASAPKGREKERRAIGGAIGAGGKMAEWGEPVEEILRVNEKCNSFTRAYGVGIRSAIHPVTGLPIMPMPEDEIELGIGVHGESSGNRIKLPRAKDLAVMICDILLDDMPIERGEEIVLRIGGLGGMTWMELNILYKDIYEYLVEDKGLKYYSSGCGNSGTQELGGFIVSIARLDDEIKKWQERPSLPPDHKYNLPANFGGGRRR